MVRRTLSLPDSIDDLVGRERRPRESYSATVARLLQAGARRDGHRPSYIAAGEGPRDLGRLAEQYLREVMRKR